MTGSMSRGRKSVFVTGASHGVGAATALLRFDIALLTSTENLAGTLRNLARLGVRTLPLELDLRSKPGTVARSKRHSAVSMCCSTMRAPMCAGSPSMSLRRSGAG
jgi:NAD(P)-dependent dehydrogenase (short-subunit alcohol dehydrogenase family)